MKNNLAPTISIVIPVYNEADSLDICLQAIAAQTVRPLEVIVVDNNSSDDTVAVALKYPFVRVLHETRQGVVFARDAGFDAARGEIIGRIDADSRIHTDWVERIQALFSDKTMIATSGRVYYGDITFPRLVNSVEAAVRGWLARRMRGAMFLQGANMAVRRSAWRKVRAGLCRSGDMHEDFDVALHLRDVAGRITYEPSLHATISARRLGSGFRSFISYALLNPRTYAQHDAWQRVYMYPVVWATIFLYGFLGAMYKGYDPTTGHFQAKRLLEPDEKPARVNPATFHD